MAKKSSLFDDLFHIASRLSRWVKSFIAPDRATTKSAPEPTVEVLTQPVRRVELAVMAPATPKPAVKKVPPAVVPEIKAPACPFCRKAMVTKQARSGANAGGNFWGCVDYPKCRGIRPIFAPMRVK